jgi:hypothetical protein
MEISEKQASGIESKSISPDETELLNYTRISQRLGNCKLVFSCFQHLKFPK